MFCLLRDHLWWAKALAEVLLVVIISGWLPRVTGVLHCWVCYSLVNSSLLVDGGDHVNLVLSSLLLPITLTDPRKWHWSKVARTSESETTASGFRRLTAWSAHTVIRLQVAIIYLHAAFAKCSVDEWQNGTATYYWLSDPQYGLPDWLRPLVLPIFRQRPWLRRSPGP